jgi:PAS domain S-box-containing protein
MNNALKGEQLLTDEHYHLLNILSEPVIIYDANGNVMYINSAGIKSLGFDPHGLHNTELINKISSSLPDGNKLTEYRFIFNRVLKGEAVSNITFRFTDAHGIEKMCSCSASPITTKGEITGALSIWHDITKINQMENLLRKERNRFLKILDSFQDGIYICSQDFSIEYVNPVLKKRFGNFEQKKCFEYLYRRNEKCPWCKNDEVFAGIETKREWQDPADGKTYEITETAIENFDGSLSKLIIFHDITKRKEKENRLTRSRLALESEVEKVNIELEDAYTQLKKQSEILETLFSTIHYMMAYLDKNFHFIRVNKAYAMIDGRPEEFFIGKNHFDVYPNDENRQIFMRVVETGEPFTVYAKPFTYPDKPEKEITYWDWSLQPVKDSRGAVEGLILILLDVTERKKAEENLLKTQIALSEAKRLSDIGTLAATVAHELRNPLGVIQAAIYNIKRKSTESRLEKHIDNIGKKVAESEQIINNLLNYSRIKQPKYKTIHLFNFIDECIDSVLHQYTDFNVTLKRDYNPFKGMSITIDPFQIREVLANIINNAYQALPHKKGMITVKGETSDDEEITIRIADNGKGIDKEDIERLFDPFFTRKSKGTGLGLTICKELVNMHKGSITVTSEKEKGTEVTVTLPLRNTYET